MSLSPEAATLQAYLAQIEPAARLVPARALRRAIRIERDRGEFHRRAVHDRSWWVDRDYLFRNHSPTEFGLSPDEPHSQLLLLPAPADGSPPPSVEAWNRILFHAAVDRAYDQHSAPGAANRAWTVELSRSFGPARWASIREVLSEENLIDEYDRDTVVLREFCAFGLELLYFRPKVWNDYFPGISPEKTPIDTIREMVAADQFAEKLRTTASPSPPIVPPVQSAPFAVVVQAPLPVSEKMLRQISKWSERGNDLSAALLLQQAGDERCETYLNSLVERLKSILNLTATEVRDWQAALRELLPVASSGGWPAERRLLYEVQRACIAAEKPTYAADLVEWAVTFGRRPIKRLLTKPIWPNVTRHLIAAMRHADRLGTCGPLRESVRHLLERGVEIAEQKARADLRPEIATVLDTVGLTARTVPEQRSREKLVEELLDGACHRGFFRIGDLRDAIARNRVKLPDLQGPGELITGDPLIRANRLLAERLDGVYRRGEAYMRLLQRGCSLFFGTRPGRLFTRYVALPFGGAFVLLEAIHHMVEAGEGLVNWVSGWSATFNGFTALAGTSAGTVIANPHPETTSVRWPVLLAVGFFLLLLIHWPAFRTRIARAIRFTFIKAPRSIYRSPLVRFLFRNALTRFFARHLLLPLLSGGLAATLTRLIVGDWTSVALVGGGVAVLAGTYFRTPMGQAMEDRLNEAAERLWRVISVNFVMGTLTLILQFFQAVFEAIDRSIYAVDEWFRFREGEGRFVFLFKLVFGALWFILTYLFRFAWTLLVEPQINPIKHFPVVTVSHKLLLPLIPSLAKSFGTTQETMGTIVFGIPGIFGFLVWELKENWKLYQANAPSTIRPAIVGSHGERVRALLRPGFHSGVIPKTFTKLRRAIRSGNDARANRYRHALEHVAESIHRFAIREMAAYLHGSRRWSRSIVAGMPILAPNRIRIPFVLDDAPDPVIVILEERGGWVIASVEVNRSIGTMSLPQRATFEDALIGFYKSAGVHAVREQTAQVFGPQSYQFDAVPEGLIIEMSDGRELIHAYDDGSELRSSAGSVPSGQVVFSDQPLFWGDWVDRWEADAAAKSPLEPLLPGWQLLRGPSDQSSSAPDQQSADHNSQSI